MKEIPLSQGKVAWVDDDDYERVSQYKWYTRNHVNIFYAGRKEVLRTSKEAKETGKPYRKIILMHRFIMDAPDGMEVDHINHNGLDNQKENLRICTRNQNRWNQLPKGGTSKYKGVVYWCYNPTKKWKAQIRYHDKNLHLGLFENEIEAAKAYDAKAEELFGPYAYLNFPEKIAV